MTYFFRREDNGEIVEVDWATMMEQYAGCITLPDGVLARRCYDLEEKPPKTESKPAEINALDYAERPIVSDAMGITYQQLDAFEADRVRHGFTGVEFKPDPLVKGFYQAHFSSRREWERYVKHRGQGGRLFSDLNSSLGSGSMLTQADLDNAAERVKRDLEERKHGT